MIIEDYRVRESEVYDLENLISNIKDYINGKFELQKVAEKYISDTNNEIYNLYEKNCIDVY